MDGWKIVSGAAIAVAIVVALPVAGPVGAITFGGASIAAGVGAVAGGIVDYFDDSEETAKAQGKAEGKAETEAKYKNDFASMEAAFKARANDDKSYFDLVLALHAVGFACAGYRGNVSPAKQLEIDEFISGAATAALPNRVRIAIEQIARTPPDIATAYALACKAAPNHMHLFEDVIEIASQSDEPGQPSEYEFKSAWAQLRAA